MAELTAPVLSPDDAGTMLWCAVAAVRSGLERRPVAGMSVPSSLALNALGASFVTLERGPRLLGCIGTLEPVRPLYEDVMTNAYKSAFADPRLPEVTPDDYAAMDVKVSLLSRLAPMEAGSRSELAAELVRGRDGVLLVGDGFRATFLPSVWERVATADQFVELLLRKGGRGGDDGWAPGMRAFRYRTMEYAQPGPRRAIDRPG
jgi:AmmeMemoRadiSam system protein A